MFYAFIPKSNLVLCAKVELSKSNVQSSPAVVVRTTFVSSGNTDLIFLEITSKFK